MIFSIPTGGGVVPMLTEVLQIPMFADRLTIPYVCRGITNPYVIIGTNGMCASWFSWSVKSS